MKTYPMFTFNRVANLDLLLCSREFSFELDIFLPECRDRLFEFFASLFQMSDEFPGVPVRALDEKENQRLGNGWQMGLKAGRTT